MADIKNSLLQISRVEDLSNKNTIIHRIQPTVKVVLTIIYLFVIISFSQKQLSGLIPFILFPVIIMVLAQIPYQILFRRILIVLPFVLFAGVSNLLFDNEVVFYLWSIGITGGMVSFCTILLKTFLTVLAVFLLIATTSMNDLLYVMLRFKIPSIIVSQIIMTYRYLEVLLVEAYTMYHAYMLRASKEKGIRLKDMGTFLGQLIIRSFDRGERIYNAMKCRGFREELKFTKRKNSTQKDWLYIIIIGSIFLFLRFVNISKLMGDIFI